MILRHLRQCLLIIATVLMLSCMTTRLAVPVYEPTQNTIEIFVVDGETGWPIFAVVDDHATTTPIDTVAVDGVANLPAREGVNSFDVGADGYNAVHVDLVFPSARGVRLKLYKLWRA
jgi:hypothetical protein